VSSVVVPDYSAKAFSGGGEFVFEFLDGFLRCVGFGGAGVPFGYELAVAGFQCCDPEGGASNDRCRVTLGPVRLSLVATAGRAHRGWLPVGSWRAHRPRRMGPARLRMKAWQN
jgi:hypothetical protein